MSNSTYLQADLSEFRRYECASAADGEVIVAHRDSRQLLRWLHMYHDANLVRELTPADPTLCRRLPDHAAQRLLHASADATGVSVQDSVYWSSGSA